MLGTELSLALERRGIPYEGTDREVDITDSAAVKDFAKQFRPRGSGTKPGWIINCAAYTAVDKAEEEPEICRLLNVRGAGNLAEAGAAFNLRLLQISTDYVFDGRGITENGTIRPYREDDPTNPTGVYGRTKRDGENAVMETSPAFYILRTAWLYGAHGNNFVRTMLRLMTERDTLAVVDDQRGSPTWAYDLAEALAALIIFVDSGHEVPYGIYHYTNEGNITWYDFARQIQALGREKDLLNRECTLTPCTSAEYPAKVKRPSYSVLDKTKIRTALGITVPGWERSLNAFMETL
jgi:dTDP-4-dehydrorhamnose reductase